MNSYLEHLECPKCHKTYDAGKLHNLCECGAPLLVRYRLKDMKREFDPALWQNRPQDLWRYEELLPLLSKQHMVRLGAGGTPVFPLDATGRAYGLKQLYLKDEGFNPTATFKARGAAVGVSKAKELGVKAMAMPTNGNAGGAWAAYCARAGLTMIVAMPADSPYGNQAECAAYGAKTYLVEGLISDCGKVIHQGCVEHGWFEVATLKEPYRIEGKKTMGLEIWEQFKDGLPAAIIYPTGGGVGLIGMWKAFNELKELGLISGQLPKMVAVQSTGCEPIVRAFNEGKDKAEFHEGAATFAAGIRVPAALGDFLVLQAVRESGGIALSVTDDEIFDAWEQVAKTDGMFICPEGAAAVRAAKAIKDRGIVGPDDPVLVLNTGGGIKYTDLLREKAKRFDGRL